MSNKGEMTGKRRMRTRHVDPQTAANPGASWHQGVAQQLIDDTKRSLPVFLPSMISLRRS